MITFFFSPLFFYLSLRKQLEAFLAESPGGWGWTDVSERRMDRACTSSPVSDDGPSDLPPLSEVVLSHTIHAYQDLDSSHERHIRQGWSRVKFDSVEDNLLKFFRREVGLSIARGDRVLLKKRPNRLAAPVLFSGQ